MDEERFVALMKSAREYAHAKPYDLVVGEVAWENAQKQLGEILRLLETECTQGQWMTVLEAISRDWP